MTNKKKSPKQQPPEEIQMGSPTKLLARSRVQASRRIIAYSI